MFPKTIKYFLTVKISDTSCPVCHHTRSIMISPSQYGLLLPEESIYQESGTGDCQGELYKIQGRKTFTHLLETLLTKRTMNRDVFAVKPVTLLLNLINM